MTSLHLRIAALSDVGRVRRDNQDSGYAGQHLLVVADGVGGAARGDIASSAAVDAIRRLDATPGDDALSELSAAIHRAHDRLAEIVEQHPELDGTSTTVSAAIFDGAHLQVGHVGDSRAYLLHDGELQPLTTDHTLVQGLVDEGRITEDEARVHPHRNLILKAVDGVHDPEPDLSTVDVEAGDRVLFCSDGCSGVLDRDQLAAYLGEGDLDDAATTLVREALAAGSSDNVTVVLAEVVEDEPAERDPLVVGAAAREPHLHVHDAATGNLTDDDLEALAAEDDPTGTPDEFEDLRYAPQAPRRFRWLRRAALLVVVIGLFVVAATGLYSWSQKQYYVAAADDRVAIFKGVEVDLPGLDMQHVEERTDIGLDELESYDAGRVRDGINADSLADARRIIADLRLSCPEPPVTTPATPSGSPSGSAATAPASVPPTTPATPESTAGPSPSRPASPATTTPPAPTGTASPDVTDGCVPAGMGTTP